MSSPGVRAAMRLVRSVQSGPLEIRIPTLLRKSASDRLPPGCPAKTFRIVTWKLTTATSTTTRTPPLRREGGFHPRLQFCACWTHRPLRRNPFFLVGATRENFQRFVAALWPRPRVPRIQTSPSSYVVRITGIAFGCSTT
jgi:hypothetical protein